MSFVTVNGFDVQHASQLLAYENLFPSIQHINGKGCIDTYTKAKDIANVTYIDISRPLAYPYLFRRLGAQNNGKFHNTLNEGGFNNAPQSVHYTVSVDLFYDTGAALTSVQEDSTNINVESITVRSLIKAAGQVVNIATYAKQIEGYFRNGDNFDKAKKHNKGAIVAGDITADEIAAAVFAYDPAAVGSAVNSPTRAFQAANSSLSDGVPEIGAYVVPADERQAFITTGLDLLMKQQYMQNASEASARILANGFVNPYTGDDSGKRIDATTGLCGMYDGVDMFILNKATRPWIYEALGILGTANDADATLTAVRASLDKMTGIIVYAAGTCRGIVGPTVEVNKHPFQTGVYCVPYMKLGVDVLHGASIKLIINGGTALADTWTAANIAQMMNAITFTPIDGVTVKGVVPGFNTGTTN